MHKDKSLSQLDWNPGELIAFDDADPEFPQPLLLVIPDRLVRCSEENFPDSDNTIRLAYCPDSMREDWILYFRGGALGLWSPRYKGKSEVPHFISFKKWKRIPPYFVEYALSGKENILNYLKNNKQGLAFYAECMKNDKLVTERSQLEKFIEALGLKSLLPCQLRFRK